MKEQKRKANEEKAIDKVSLYINLRINGFGKKKWQHWLTKYENQWKK